MRLIDADKLKQTVIQEFPIMSNWGESFVISSIDEAETVDAAPVVHGKWQEEIIKATGEWKHKFDTWQPISCSICHKPAHNEYPYCPNCGAKMDLKDD